MAPSVQIGWHVHGARWLTHAMSASEWIEVYDDIVLISPKKG